jgi:hypothetical protein
VWSVALLLADIGTRRIAWDRLLSREFGSSIRREAAVAMRGRGAEAAAASERLRKVEPALGNASTRPAAGSLGTDDAVAIVREQAARRRQSRQEPSRAEQNEVAAVPQEKEPAHEEAGGLLAAKRRAKQRIEEQREDGKL